MKAVYIMTYYFFGRFIKASGRRYETDPRGIHSAFKTSVLTQAENSHFPSPAFLLPRTPPPMHFPNPNRVSSLAPGFLVGSELLNQFQFQLSFWQLLYCN